MQKICKLCGQTFETNFARQSYCKKPIEAVCPVCGDTFTIYCQPQNATTCNKTECKKKAGYFGSIKAKKICKICGSEFIGTSSTQEYCNKPITRICEVCGKEFTIKCTAEEYKKKTCSSECMNKLASENRQLSHMKETKICEWCGKEFHPRSNTQRFCDEPHYQTCCVCGKQFKLEYKGTLGETLSDVRKTCSEECSKINASNNCAFRRPEVQDKIKATMLEKYGVEHPGQNSEILEKQKETTKMRYGSEYYSQTEEYKDKAISTNRRKYGTDWAIQNKDIQTKRENTNLERFGYKSPMNNPDILKKIEDNYESKTGYRSPLSNPDVIAKSKEYFLDNYGVEYYSQTEEFKKKYKDTCQERYGVDNPNQSPVIRAKTEQTCLEKYGSTNYLSSEEGKKKSSERMQSIYGRIRYSQTAEWKLSVMKTCTNIEEWIKFCDDPENYILSNYEGKPTYRKIASNIGVEPSTVCDVVYRHGINNLIKISYSYMEEELIEFLESLSCKSIVKHNRNIIKPYELDVTIPSIKFALECNPTSTHNSSIPYKNLDEISVTPTDYHQMKTDMCEEQGWFLFHIFGYEWYHKKEILKSMIRNVVGKNETTIYARKCSVKEVSWEESIEFLETNHRQGSANSPIRLGLEYEGKLVSLMTFGKMRGTIGTGKEDLSNCYELVRFCNLLNTSVVGAASKLFSHFVRKYNPERVRSFSDRARAKGTLYSTLGFSEVRRSDPGYVWVDIETDEGFNRVNAQKHNIKKFLKDDSIDLSKSEREIMIEHGFVQVFDCGTILWEWKKGDLK